MVLLWAAGSVGKNGEGGGKGQVKRGCVGGYKWGTSLSPNTPV